MNRTHRRAAGVVAAAVVLAGCSGEERSVEAYCSTFYGEGSELRDQWTEAGGSDLLGQAVTLLQAPQDLATFFDKLEKVAPDDIQPDVAAVRDSLKDQIDAMTSIDPGSPWKAALQSMLIGVSSGGSWQRVDEWTLENCGPPPGSEQASGSASADESSTSAPASPTATAEETTAPAPGTTLLSALPTDGRVNVITNGSGFTVVQSLTDGTTDRSQVTAYDAAGNRMATVRGLTGECGAADVTPDGRRLLVTALVTEAPAQGINPATYGMSLTGWDALTGARVWEAEIIASTTDQLHCTAFDGRLLGNHISGDPIAVTSDSAWGVVQVASGNTTVSSILDLATGQLRPEPDALGTLGAFVVTGTNDTVYSGEPNRAELVVPPAPQPLGSFEFGVDDGTVAISFPEGAARGVAWQARAVVSDDGEVLVSHQDSGNASVEEWRALALPTMSPLWTRQVTTGLETLLAEGGGALVIGLSDANGDSTIGLDTATGELRWTLPEVEVCGITSTQMLVSANNQLAVIDLDSGEQLSYEADSGGGCPVVLPGGIRVDTSGGTVTQVLTP